MNSNLETARNYYLGWETSDRSLLKLSPDLTFSSPDDKFSGAEEYLNACWKYSGMKFHNKILLAEGDNVCIKYEINMPDGKMKPFVEWLTFSKGVIKEIMVFYDK